MQGFWKNSKRLYLWKQLFPALWQCEIVLEAGVLTTGGFTGRIPLYQLVFKAIILPPAPEGSGVTSSAASQRSNEVFLEIVSK